MSSSPSTPSAGAPVPRDSAQQPPAISDAVSDPGVVDPHSPLPSGSRGRAAGPGSPAGGGSDDEGALSDGALVSIPRAKGGMRVDSQEDVDPSIGGEEGQRTRAASTLEGEIFRETRDLPFEMHHLDREQMAAVAPYRAKFMRKLAAEKVWVPRKDRPPQHQTGRRL